MSGFERQRAQSNPLRVLLFSTLYPSEVRPAHGVFVETRLRELLKTGEVDVRVVAPVPPVARITRSGFRVSTQSTRASAPVVVSPLTPALVTV